MKQNDQGIFLHRTAFSDSSLIVTYYTAEKGLRKFVFKGGKKKAHQLFPLAPTELTFYGRQESDLLQLTGTEALFATDFQFDPVKSTIAFFIAETIRKCVHEFDTDQHVFDFIREQIEKLQKSKESLAHFPLYFLIDFTEILGVQPLVEQGGTIFDLDEGNIGKYAQHGHLTAQGEAVACIVSKINGVEMPVGKQIRDTALHIMMQYYKLHVPGLREFETYAIVQEILS
ncbi:MAG: DNA repair protein RecO [bacterium]|nr:DNA repair protein RecO [bacterium]